MFYVYLTTYVPCLAPRSEGFIPIFRWMFRSRAFFGCFLSRLYLSKSIKVSTKMDRIYNIKTPNCILYDAQHIFRIYHKLKSVSCTGAHIHTHTLTHTSIINFYGIRCLKDNSGRFGCAPDDTTIWWADETTAYVWKFVVRNVES